jgi:hypothetical protein
MKSFMICSPHQKLFGRSNREEAYMVRGEMHTGLWCGNLKERDHFEDPGIDRRIIFRWIFRKWDAEVWTGLIWFWTGPCKRGNEPSGSMTCGESLD